MDPNSNNIYSELLFPLSQGWPLSSSGSAASSQGTQLALGNSHQVPLGLDDLDENIAHELDESSEEHFSISKLVVRASDLRQQYCTTGCHLLDYALKGGIQTFGITELYGEGGTAKTQLCLQLSITAQLPERAGGLESGVMYICTEDAFPSKRLAELVYYFNLKYPNDLPEPMDNIFIEHVTEVETLMHCVSTKLESLARSRTKKIRLVILDSVGIFRSEFDDLSRRTSELRRLGQLLHEFSHEHSAGVVVCNQVSGSPSSSEGNVASLGTAWKNMVTTRMRLSKSDDHERRSIYTCFSPHIPSIDIPFQVYTDGVRDVQFNLLLRNYTNLSRYDLETIFNLLDVDHSGEIEFEEFYLVFCILIANKDSYEKEFIYRHSATIFQLIDADASGQISSAEFSHMGVLFNFDHSAINRIFNEFDISGDKSLDFGEFRLFTMACIDEARAQETREKVKSFGKYRERLLRALEPTLRRYVRTDRLPRPREIEEIVGNVRRPYIPGRKDFSRPFKYGIIKQTFQETREELRDYFKQKIGNIPCMFCFVGYILCCYCCIEDPLRGSGKVCQCKCRCSCVPCWFTYIRKLFACWYCIFPCCHCCQPPDDYQQHIARIKKVRWPSPPESEHETDSISNFNHHQHDHHLDQHYPRAHKSHGEFKQEETCDAKKSHATISTTADKSHLNKLITSTKASIGLLLSSTSSEFADDKPDTVTFARSTPSLWSSKGAQHNPNDKLKGMRKKSKKTKPIPQPVEKPKWCRTH